MCSVVVAFAVSAVEGIAGGVLQNYKLNDAPKSTTGSISDEDQLTSRLLVNTQRDALTDFYMYGSNDDIYEEFTAQEATHYFFEEEEEQKDKKETDALPSHLKWRENRVPGWKWLGTCVKYSFYITVLGSFIVGSAAVLLMFVDINTADVCSDVQWKDIPISVQRIRVTVQIFEGWLLQFFHIFTMLLVFGWDVIGPLHLLNWNLSAAFLDSVYRLYLQIYNVYDSAWISGPLNALFVGMMVFNSYRISRFFHRATWKKAVLTFQLGSQFMLGTLTLYSIVYLLIPWFVQLSPLQQAIVAAAAPLSGAICKTISRLAIQNVASVNHPGTSYVLVVAVYSAAPIVYRTLQAEVESFKYFALLCIAHGFVGLLERLSVVLRDHFYVWFYKKVLKRERISCHVGMFRTPRTQRLIADLTICNIIQEIAALILTNAFVQLYALQFGSTADGKNFNPRDILIEFLYRTILATASEFVFTLFGIFIMTWYLNLPIVRIWRNKWKTLLFTNLITCCVLVLYTTQHLVTVVDSKYRDVNETKTCDPSQLLFFKNSI
ncbi:uncharacterized protein LOC130647160 isoform X2 [Hydractinia symbiolongicarpus]|nr:uncharacterized protein LOC130647160 isoform X2 [Hydractinia symbiolongicarpus]XP_057308903.1 uncharacterized protein LOC130647160 isoform X2 [Hydractinia symbiolongicarpus]XP_057308904.1 uncharacterized protein LOC130647160 isoform X2 [Hydractinia symbiolongicarpus]